MAASLASPRNARASHTPNPALRNGNQCRINSCSTTRVPESTFRITPYGQESTYPYGHYQRPVNYEGPLDDIKQKIRASKDHCSKFTAAEEDSYSSDSESDGELDESPRRHKVKKLGVL